MDLALTARAARRLIDRQQLPPALGPDAVRPSYDGLGLTGVSSFVAQQLGLDPTALALCPTLAPDLLEIPELTDAWQRWLQQGPIRHVVTLLFDGLGYDQLIAAMHENNAANLARRAAADSSFFMPVTTVFPSATTAALTTVATALPPAQHGVTGTMVYLREIGSAVNMIGFRPYIAPSYDSYTPDMLPARTLVPTPNLFAHLEAKGITTAIINAQIYKGTSISRFTTWGSRAGEQDYHGYVTPADGFVQLRRHLERRQGKPPSYTYMYVSTVDTLAHRYGPARGNTSAELAMLDFLLGREILGGETNRPDTVLLLIADHGQIRTRPDHAIWVEELPELARLLTAPVMGESRAGYLLCKHGQESAVRAYVQQHLGDRVDILSKDEAVGLGLFGPPGCPLALPCDDRVGDFVVLPKGDATVRHHVTAEKRHEPNAGVHGGLTRAEMLVPFLAMRLG